MVKTRIDCAFFITEICLHFFYLNTPAKKWYKLSYLLFYVIDLVQN